MPYREDPHRYARSTRLVPASCETDVVALLVEVRRRTHALVHGDGAGGDDTAFAAATEWGSSERVMRVPAARPGSHEDLLHHALGHPAVVVFGDRYDALVWFEETRALQPLHHEPRPAEPEYETEPSGF